MAEWILNTAGLYTLAILARLKATKAEVNESSEHFRIRILVFLFYGKQMIE